MQWQGVLYTVWYHWHGRGTACYSGTWDAWSARPFAWFAAEATKNHRSWRSDCLKKHLVSTKPFCWQTSWAMHQFFSWFCKISKSIVWLHRNQFGRRSFLQPLFTTGPSVSDSGCCSEDCAHNPAQELLPRAKSPLRPTIHFESSVTAVGLHVFLVLVNSIEQKL